MQEEFTEIYMTNRWGGTESKSGPGSGIEQTRVVREGLEKIFKVFKIRSILDIPCGDFNWMKLVDLTGIQYMGADIVEEAVRNCSKNFPYTFQVLDITSSPLPTVDLILSRDCLVHLPYSDIFKALENIRKSGSKFLLTTSFTELETNIEGKLGGWRPINLLREPFNLPSPLTVVNEGKVGQHKDKSLLLFEL